MRVLRWAGIAAAIVVVLIGAAVALVLRDPAAIVTRAGPAVERATGRRIAVGSVTPDVLGGGVTLHDVMLRADDPEAAPQEITAKEARASIALWPLLSGRIEVRAVTITDAAAVFETDAQGALHVRFAPAKSAPAPDAQIGTPSARTPAAIDAIHVERATLTLRNRRSGTEDRAEIATLDVRRPPGADATLTASGAVRAVPFALTASRGQPASDGAPVKIAVVSGADHAAFEGVLGDAVDGTVTLAMPDPAVVTPLLGTLVLPPVDVSGHVEGSTSRQRFDLTGTAYGSRVHAVGDFVSDPRPALHATVTADRLDPAAWTAHARAAPVPQGVPAAAAPVSVAVPDSPVARPAPDLSKLKGFDADITLTADVIEPGIKAVSAHLVLADGVLTADPIAATYAGVTASGRATLDARASPPRFSALLPGIKIPAAALGPYVPLLRGASGTADVHADIRTSGVDADAMERSLSGRLGVAMVDGAVAPSALAPILAAAKLPLALPGALTAVRCLAVRADFDDGLGRFGAIVLDSAALRLTGGGGVNLRDQTLALRLHPQLRAGGFGVSVPVDVNGPLAAPRIVPDIASGGGAAGLVIGALQAAAGGGTDDPCPAGLAAARFLAAPGTAAPPALAPMKMPKPADLLRGLLR